MKRFTLLFVLFLFPVLCSSADYSVVVKKTGKVIQGELLKEDDTTVSIKSGGIQMNFKKDQLDLEKMTELNAPAPEPAAIPAGEAASAEISQAPGKPKKARVYTQGDIEEMREKYGEMSSDSEGEEAAEGEGEGKEGEKKASPAKSEAPKASPEEQAASAVQKRIDSTLRNIAETEEYIEEQKMRGNDPTVWEQKLQGYRQKLQGLREELARAKNPPQQPPEGEE